MKTISALTSNLSICILDDPNCIVYRDRVVGICFYILNLFLVIFNDVVSNVYLTRLCVTCEVFSR